MVSAIHIELSCAAAITALLIVSTVAQGADVVGAELARRLLLEGKVLPLEEVVGHARLLHEGSLIEANLQYEADHAGYVYELHMLDTAGAVWELEFHADSGKLIEHEIVDR